MTYGKLRAYNLALGILHFGSFAFLQFSENVEELDSAVSKPDVYQIELVPSFENRKKSLNFKSFGA